MGGSADSPATPPTHICCCKVVLVLDVLDRAAVARQVAVPPPRPLEHIREEPRICTAVYTGEGGSRNASRVYMHLGPPWHAVDRSVTAHDAAGAPALDARGKRHKICIAEVLCCDIRVEVEAIRVAIILALWSQKEGTL